MSSLEIANIKLAALNATLDFFRICSSVYKPEEVVNEEDIIVVAQQFSNFLLNNK